MAKRVTIADQVLALLSEGGKWADEIVSGVSAQPVSIRMCLCKLLKQGVIVRVKRGIYRKKEVLKVPGTTGNRRKNSENVETINLLLNMYDQVNEKVNRIAKTQLIAVILSSKSSTIHSWIKYTTELLQKQSILTARKCSCWVSTTQA